MVGVRDASTFYNADIDHSCVDVYAHSDSAPSQPNDWALILCFNKHGWSVHTMHEEYLVPRSSVGYQLALSKLYHYGSEQSINEMPAFGPLRIATTW